MIRGIYHSAAGMLPRYHKLTNISNNLANASTTAFKADRRFFSFTLNNELTQPGINGQAKKIERLNEGLYIDFEQGALTPTGRKTDFAIKGQGFFVVQNEEGKQFLTRDGRFRINDARELVTPAGYNVLDDGYTPIQIPDGSFFTDDTGMIYVNQEENSRFLIAEPPSRDAIRKIGDNLYEQTNDDDLTEVEDASVHQEHLEASNVNVVREMVEMISLNRTYDTSQRALTAQDNTLGRLIDRVPRF
ncbi:MAG TPA: flagellar basal-body rod protein FlgF [Bacteroidetes bacterium]|nr:flagellar basal-body rod protein FlgF [Bacteroidota bacterium]HEX04781.1 flagellar basal-body rod protein FlgF [Bacteroidota bacterium]